jgi:hypothetical protein
MRSIAWLALALLAITSSALADDTAETPRIYRWIDENGIAHYTTTLDRVPEGLRDQPLRRDDASTQAPASVDAWVQRERVADPPPPSASAPSSAAGDPMSVLNARIAELEQAIAADEALLKDELTDAAAPASNDALEEVAERMPQRIAELKKLQAERDALAAPPSE